ncbi:MAG: hypothetical protein ACRENE_14105 [Polyangiaceae bacterium]
MGVVVVASTGCQLIVSSGDYAVGPDTITSADGSSSGSDATSSGGSSGSSSGSASDAHGSSDAGPHVGDPCTAVTDCPHGATCQGTWCTQSCVSSVQCGVNSVGQANLCVMTAGGKACVPGCSTDADCTQYGASATCTAASASGTSSYCNVPSTTTDSGSSSGGGAIGDPCAADTDCASPATCLGSWCSTSCTPGSCGSTSLGQPNYCVVNKNDSMVCFPGCSTNASCYSYSGTTCQPITTSSSVCSRTAGVTGDPCSTTNTTEWNPCVGSDGGVDSNACSIGGAACSKYCSTDADCGTNSAGQVNFCVNISSTAPAGMQNICFPGCTQYADCAPYSGGYCQPIYMSTRGFICAGTGGAIGDPCTTDLDCTDAAATCPNGWCTQPCSSSTDTSCGKNDANNNNNSCVFDSSVGQYTCEPGCIVETDCLAFAGTTCKSVPGGMKACSF